MPLKSNEGPAMPTSSPREPPPSSFTGTCTAVVFSCAVLAVLFLRLQVIWPIGFYQDDAAAVNWAAGAARNGSSIYGMCHWIFKWWIVTEGRVVPVLLYLVAPLQMAIGENLVLYRLLQAVFQLAALIAFAAVIRRVSGDRWLGWLVVVLYASVYEIRDYHDPAYGQGITFPLIAIFGCLSWLSALNCADDEATAWNRHWWLTVLFSLLGILTLEYAIPFCMIACIFLLYGRSPRRVRWLRALAAGLPVLLIVGLGMVLKRKSTYAGTTLGSLNPGVIGSTFFGQAVSGLPLAYGHYDSEHLFQGGWSYHANTLSAAAIGVAAAVAIAFGLSHTRPKKIGTLAWVGAILFIVPPLLIAVSAKYQTETLPGRGYVETCYTYGGFCLLLTAGLAWLRARLEKTSRFLGFGLALAVGVGAGIVAAQTTLEAQRVADSINRGWRYPREMLEVWMRATRPQPRSPELFVIERTWLTRWENDFFLYEHRRSLGQVITRGDFEAKGRPVPAGTTLIDLRYTANSGPNGRFFVVAGLASGLSAHQAVRLSAFVISADRSVLEQGTLVLEKGKLAWAFPGQILVGYRGYYYRELEIPVDSPYVDDCHLLVE